MSKLSEISNFLSTALVVVLTTVTSCAWVNAKYFPLDEYIAHLQSPEGLTNASISL